MRINSNDDYRPYDWLQVLAGLGLGAFVGIFARGAGYSSTVAWAAGTTVGVLATAAFALMFWVERRQATGVEAGRPEQTARTLSDFATAYGRFNRVTWYLSLALLVVLLVWLGLRG